jgi:hypothetical protein
MASIKTLTNRMGIAGDLLAFFWARKLWWMMPMIILLLAFGLLIGFAQTSAIAPFIYTLF